MTELLSQGSIPNAATPSGSLRPYLEGDLGIGFTLDEPHLRQVVAQHLPHKDDALLAEPALS
jgi:hypothetical protein